jgi:hypothetical protein
MAIVQNPLIGSAKKSAGAITFTRVKGQNIIKTKPLTVKNPRTTGQTDNRLRFLLVSLMGIFVATFSHFTLPQLRNYPGGADLAGKIKRASKDCVSVANGVITWLGSKFTTGGIKMLSFIPFEFSAVAGGNASIEWLKTQVGAQTTSDVRIKMYLFNLTQKELISVDNNGAGYLHTAEVITTALPITWAEGDVVSCMLETYSNLATEMPGEKYATGWLGRPDIVSTDDCVVVLAG